MRIALVSDTYTPQVNGVTTVLRRIVSAVHSAGHDAVVVAPEYPDKQTDTRADELRVPSMAFPPYPAIRLSLPAQGRVAHFLDGFRPDLVHVATEGPLGLVGRRFALKRALPLITSYHTHFPRYCREYGMATLESAAWRYMRWFHRPARLVQTPGEEARAELVHNGIPQVVLWGNGIDTRRFDPARRDPALRHRLGIAEHEVAVLHVGRLAPEKNLDVLIHAYSSAREALGSRARFVVAGDGPLVERVTSRLPWAIHLGFLPLEAISALYASCDVCVLPSETETCGLVALEAMASGIPVVAADAGGFRDSVDHGATGLRVPAHQPTAFTAGIIALALDAPRRRALGAEARRRMLARDTTAEDAVLLEQYAEVTGHPERQPWRAAS